MKQLTLSINDRLNLIGVIRSMEFDRLGAITLNSVLSEVVINEAERADMSMQQSTNGLIWDAKKGTDKTIDLTAEQVYQLKQSMNVMNDRKKITIDLLPLDSKITQL